MCSVKMIAPELRTPFFYMLLVISGLAVGLPLKIFYQHFANEEIKNSKCAGQKRAKSQRKGGGLVITNAQNRVS
jgi:hypothetical protein